jgi:ribonuclease-3 family protein
VAQSLNDLILEQFPTEKKTEPGQYSPLALAFLGDAVFSLIIRTVVLSQGSRQAEKLHNETNRIVRASMQAKLIDAMQPFLTDEEAAIYRRGRNANPHHKAHSATEEDYRKATALETLCGYLYLKGETARFLQLLRQAEDALEEESN